MKIYGGRGGRYFSFSCFFLFFLKTSYFSKEEEKNSPLPPSIHQDSKTRTTWILDENGMKRRGAPRPPLFYGGRENIL